MQEVFEKIIDGLNENAIEFELFGQCSDYVELSHAIDIVKQEAEQYNNGWIPCSERLPEEYGEYLCCDNCGTVEMYYFANDLYEVDKYDFKHKKGKSGFYCYSTVIGFCEVGNIIAWQPLPQPYQPKGECE